MSFEALYVYNDKSQFIGYVLKDPQVPDRLQSNLLYRENEVEKLNKRLAELNEDVDLKQHWPHPQDPAVRQLLADPTFCPINYVEREVVDDDASFYVWEQVQDVDERGNPKFDLITGKPVMVQGENIDRDASVIRYKLAKVPEKPTDEVFRIKKACEVVARQRAGLLS